MGSSPIGSSSGGDGWCRWRWHRSKSNSNSVKNGSNNCNEKCVLSSTFAYFLFSFLVLGSIGSLYARLMLTANVRGEASLGCQEDNEGSWSIGVFYGDSPFSLKPIEDVSHIFLLFTV